MEGARPVCSANGLVALTRQSVMTCSDGTCVEPKGDSVGVAEGNRTCGALDGDGALSLDGLSDGVRATDDQTHTVGRHRDVVPALEHDVRTGHGGRTSRVPREGQVLVVSAVPVAWAYQIRSVAGFGTPDAVEYRDRPGEVGDDVRFDV